jgi:hypothetical protein
MAAFEIAFAHKLITATAYMYCMIVSKRSSARVSTHLDMPSRPSVLSHSSIAKVIYRTREILRRTS